MTNKKDTLLVNLKHLHSEEECEDKSRYSAFIDYVDKNIPIELFEECKGFSNLKSGLKNQNEFIQYTSQKILGNYFKDENTFIKYKEMLGLLQNQTDILKESFLYILRCLSHHTKGKEYILKNKYDQMIIKDLVNPNQYIRKLSIDLVKIFNFENFNGCEKNEFILELIEELEDKDRYEHIIKNFYTRNSINLLKRVKNISKFEDYIKSIYDKDIHLFLYTVKTLKVESLTNFFKEKVLSLILEPKLQSKCLTALSNLPFEDEYYNIVNTIIRESRMNTLIISSALDIFLQHKNVPEGFQKLLFEIIGLNNYQTFKKTFLILKNTKNLNEKLIIESLTHFNEEIQYFVLEFLIENQDVITKEIHRIINQLIEKNQHIEITYKFLSQEDLFNLLKTSTDYKIEILKLIHVSKENHLLIQQEIQKIFYEEGINSLYDMITLNLKNFDSEFLEEIDINKKEEEEEILYFFVENEHLECE